MNVFKMFHHAYLCLFAKFYFTGYLPDVFVTLFNKWLVDYYVIFLFLLLISQIRVNDLKLAV